MGPIMLRLLPLLLACTGGTLAVTKADDLVSNLPGLTFTPNFKQYSGFLDASTGNHLHYWLVESQRTPQNDPLILWLNGGPGCSSLGGFMTELGPFHPTFGGQSLVENVHSWNKVANVLFLEAPHGVGWSYRDNSTYGPDLNYTDTKTAWDNALALQAFFVRFPEYQGREFYITGESYGGVYVPTLTDLVIKLIQTGTMSYVNLVGMAVGNGELSSYQQINSAIDLLYYRGMLGNDEFNSLKSCCVDKFQQQLTYCDFSSFVVVDDFGNLSPNPKLNTSLGASCAQKVINYSQNAVWASTNDVYNSYQDCYNNYGNFQGSQAVAARRTWKHIMGSKTMRVSALQGNDAVVNTVTNTNTNFVDYGLGLNPNATDPEIGFPCYMDDATEKYLNRPEVRKALHIPDSLPHWSDCNIPINENYYHQQNHDMTPVFWSIINSNYKLRMLIYNGDVDMACNFQGDEWFVYALANITMNTRQAWSYTRPGFDPVVAGFTQRFAINNRPDFSIDLLTVKGGGHFVPTDRPGPALQMISNFLLNRNYNNTITSSLTPQAPLPQYSATAQSQFSRKQADRIWSLPGLTYNLNFRQYSGYLSGVPGNSLHYWLVESQANPSTDPLVLWLNGGPGCSSLMGMLSELGPFHPNPDGKTLYENIYAWNKGANILFIESPRNVGFSVQDTSVNNDTIYNDEKTAWDVYLALKDFLTVYPEYIGRSFYVTGESYGGVYVPTLTSLLIKQIQSGNLPGLNLAGMAVGNGELSELKQINSVIHMLYFHGLYGKQEWDQLQQCCDPKSSDPKWFEYCDFTRFIYLNSSGDANPIDPTGVCGPLVVQMGYERVWNTINDVYNIYQDCYQQTHNVFGSVSMANLKKDYKRRMFAASFVDQASQISDVSTDNQGGFSCYSSDAAAAWLNTADVKAALHISSLAGNWSSCNDDMNHNYIQQHNDTGRVFDEIVSSNYPLRIMIYNGDVDMACNFLGDQWFIEGVAKKWHMPVVNDFKEWRFMNQIAGYAKKFTWPAGSIDLLTVKGAGHLVPTDRPGPALQMFVNFLRNQDFSNPTPYSTQAAPMTQQYVVAQQAGQVNSQSSSELKKAARPLNRHTIKTRKALRAQGKIQEGRVKREAPVPIAAPVPGNKTADQIFDLPGLTFTPGFNQYSGYLQASQGNYLHYWLVESQGNPSTDPLILWLNGGPGCSSLGGFFEELGPFHVNQDQTTLFENVYSWNKVGNVLFMEAPRDVGFSYRSSDVAADANYNDDYTASDNVLALASFFARFPEYKNRDFYITGESYGGVYVPTLTEALIQAIQSPYMNMSYVNLVGVAIGNGEMSEIQQINSAVSLGYWRGERGKTEYDLLNQCCNGTGKPITYCDWSQFYTLDVAGNAWPKFTDGSLAAQCGNIVVKQGFLDVWTTDNDVYNTFQDCYSTPNAASNLPSNEQKRRAKRSVQPLTNANPFVDQKSKTNSMSTDANQGFSCYNGDATQNYLNLEAVRSAIHIPKGVPYWTDCNDDMNANYIQQHNDTTSVFERILNSGYKLKFLIYNGDADMACQFLGDEWFIENLAAKRNMSNTVQRTSWNYTQAQGYNPQIGGYWKKFDYNSSQVTFDLLTVKGGGHFVPTDRPGPALQMLQNFVKGQNYSDGLAYSIAKKPLLSNYQTHPAPLPRRKADMVFALPGLTFQPNFNQHSGYLEASAGNYLHYWLIESQNDPGNDPLILWLNGGPGCSSLGGLLIENGPFHPNPDGQTLFENVYSWNRGANVLYLESPRGVGFSYQDTSVTNSTDYNDDMTTSDTVDALNDFFKTYPQFTQNRFYVVGESYAGVYVPDLVNSLIIELQAKRMNFNLVGMAIGNGMISSIQDVRSLPDFLYFHGIYGKQDWDNLHKCCNSQVANNTALFCDFEYYVNIDSQGNVVGKPFPNNDFNRNCGRLVEQMAFDRNWGGQYDVYNIYQDCYAKTNNLYNPISYSMSPDAQSYNGRIHMRRQLAAQMGQLSVANPGQLDPLSTDNFGGFQCYMTDAFTRYLSQSHVRDALHVPDFVQPFQPCADINYTLQYNDTTPLFESILKSGYPLDVLIYNGDTDTACSMFEAEWFIEGFQNDNGFKNDAPRSAWMYEQVIAGYTKSFTSTKNNTNMKIMLTTVKGAGHMVPTDRPGPMLQLINNFVTKQYNYNTSIPFDLTRQPLLPQYLQHGSEVVTGQAPVTTTPSAPTTTKTTTVVTNPTVTVTSTTSPTQTSPTQTTPTQTSPTQTTPTQTSPTQTSPKQGPTTPANGASAVSILLAVVLSLLIR